MKKLIPLFLFLFISFALRADYYGGPTGIQVDLIVAGLALVLFFLCCLVYWGLNSLLSRFVAKKIGFPWVQSLLSVGLVSLLITSDLTWSFLWRIEITRGSEARDNMYILLISACFILGWLVGFVVSPRRKEEGAR
jgi:hypothetical protein